MYDEGQSDLRFVVLVKFVFKDAAPMVVDYDLASTPADFAGSHELGMDEKQPASSEALNDSAESSSAAPSADASARSASVGDAAAPSSSNDASSSSVPMSIEY